MYILYKYFLAVFAKLTNMFSFVLRFEIHMMLISLTFYMYFLLTHSKQMAKAESHPISCTPPKPGSNRSGTDELDSAVTYWLQNVSRQRVSSSETESDEEGEDGDTEMTVIRTRNGVQAAGGGGGARGVGARGGKARNTSAQSYGECLIMV